MNEPVQFENYYLEFMRFDLEATKKKSDVYSNDTVVVSELVAETLCFMSNTTIGFWNKLSHVALKKETGDKTERDLIPKDITVISYRSNRSGIG